MKFDAAITISDVNRYIDVVACVVVEVLCGLGRGLGGDAGRLHQGQRHVPVGEHGQTPRNV